MARAAVTLDLVIRARRVVVDAGERPASVGIQDGVVVAIEEYDAARTAGRVVELGHDEVLMPGVVDTHVHVNDPGRTDWEGFTTATRAAAAGGVTTIVDMPLNSIPPTVDPDALDVKRKTAQGQCFVDVGFWGGAIPGNLASLRPLHDAGVFGFKCFLLPSGVAEFPPLDAAELEAAMREIAAFDGLLIAHAEHADVVVDAPHGQRYKDFLASRPGHAENAAVLLLAELARRTGCRVHVVHVSSAEVLPLLVTARRHGVRISAETCPHYLTFTAEEIADGATQYKCCPPIREAANRDRLWDGLRDGVVDMVVSDHSPCTADLKALGTGDFGEAWGGIASLQVSVSAVWTEARTRGFGLPDVARWMCSGPARLVGLPRKGRIAVGCDADFSVFAPDESFTVDVLSLQHKNPLTPYDGRTLAGVVRSTWLRGRPVDLDAAPHGRLLTRGEG